MAYMVLSVDNFYTILTTLKNVSASFIQDLAATNKETLSSDCALQFTKKLYTNYHNDVYGGIELISDDFIGLYRALIGVQNEYMNTGTYIIGKVVDTQGEHVDYYNSNKKCLFKTYCEDIIVSEFTYEMSTPGLEILYNSYHKLKINHPGILAEIMTNLPSKIEKACDKWYVIAAIMSGNSKLLEQMLKDGISPYGESNLEYIYFTILKGDIKMFEILMASCIFTKSSDPNIVGYILKSSKLSFIKWYRKTYLRVNKHDIPLKHVITHLRSPLEILKYMVTFPWL